MISGIGAEKSAAKAHLSRATHWGSLSHLVERTAPGGVLVGFHPWSPYSKPEFGIIFTCVAAQLCAVEVLVTILVLIWVDVRVVLWTSVLINVVETVEGGGAG